MKNFILVLLLLSSFIFSGSVSQAKSTSSLRCEQIFVSDKTFIQKVKNYSREVVDTKGLRLFIKDSDATDMTKWHGFLTKSRIDATESTFGKYFLAITQYVPRKLGQALSRESGYLFSPLQGLYSIAIKEPTQYLTQKFSNRKKEPAFFVKLPSILALSLAFYIPADMIYQQRLDAHVQTEISSNAVAYDKAIQNDYRYNKIKAALQKGEITQEAAEREAYLTSLAYSSYFEFRTSQKSAPSLKTEMELIDHVLFAHLKKVITEGVEKMPLESGYKVPDSAVGSLSEAQKLELFANTHQRYLKYQIIQEMVAKSETWTQLQQSEKLHGVVESIVQDPFTKELLTLHKQGVISDGQLQTYLQEDAYWQNKFQDWQTLGITRLKNENGRYVDQPLTLSDIRQEVLVEIATKKP